VGVLIEKSKAAGYVSKEPYPKGIEPKPEGEFPSTTLQNTKIPIWAPSSLT